MCLEKEPVLFQLPQITVHNWNLISGRSRFIIQDTYTDEQPSHHLHVDEEHWLSILPQTQR